MIKIIREEHPVARKEHKCMFCGCAIPSGERYRRTTNVFDGDIYDWVTHEDCHKIAQLLNMYDTDYDNGVDDTRFQEQLSEYLSANYHDEVTDDTREDVSKMNVIEQVRLVIADWDKPFIKIPRIKEEIRKTEHQLKCWHSSVMIERKEARLKELKTELKETEKL